MRFDLRARIAVLVSIRIGGHKGIKRRAHCNTGGHSVSRHPARDRPCYVTSNDDSPRARGFWNTPAIRG